MLDPILEAYLFPDLYIQQLEEEKNPIEKESAIKPPKIPNELNLEEAHIVKILEAATIGTDDILAEHSFNYIRTISINYTRMKYDANNSNSPSKLTHNGNGKPNNCLLTQLICNRHLNKVLTIIQGMNKQNQDSSSFEIRIGRFLEILRFCVIAHPESTISNVWFLPWLLEFINYDVTYIFFIKIFGYGQLYQNWLSSNDFFVAALNAAKELQNKISSATNGQNNISNDIDNKKLENLFLLFSEFLSLKTFRDKCQSPFRLSKMIKVPCKDVSRLSHHSTQYGEIEELSNFHLDTLITFSHFLCVLYTKVTKKVFEDNLGEYVSFVRSLSEIENAGSPIMNSRISHLKVNFLDLISIIIDGIDEKDDKRIEKLFSISIPSIPTPIIGSISSNSSSYVVPSSTASSVAYVSSLSEVSSSSSVVSASSFFNSSTSSHSESREQPPLFNSLLFITEASLIRPKNEFELQKALRILLAMIRKHLISEDEVADYFLAGLLLNYRKEGKPIQKISLYSIVSELPALEICVEKSMSFDFFNSEEDLELQKPRKDSKHPLEITKLMTMQNESHQNEKTNDVYHSNPIHTFDHEEDHFELDFISKMRQVLLSDYGK